MSRSATTGIYTRVSNSFSEPVVGTTISPTDADTFFDDVESCMNSFIGTSTTSLAIAVASKTFVTQLTKTFIPGTFVHAFSLANSANYMFGTVTSYSAVNGNLVVDVTAIGGSGTLADWVIMQAGARGAVGSTGSTGPTSGVKYTYSTTTADADPGAGIFRLNNATVASATAAYIDNADSDGNTVTAWLDSFDDSTTTAKGTLILRGITTPAALAIFSVTGSVVDGTGYRKLTLTYVAGGGTFTNAESFAFNFLRTGDKGADGVGTGDVVGPASATDNAVTRFDGTTGKLVKNSGVTIDVSNNVSGVAALSATTIELGHASDTSLARVSAGKASIEGGTIMLLNQSGVVATGWNVTSYNIGSYTTTQGTTPDALNGNYQHVTLSGTFTWTVTAPTTDCAIDILVILGASGSGLTVAFSGFKTAAAGASGSTFTAANSTWYVLSIRRVNSVSTYSWSGGWT